MIPSHDSSVRPLARRSLALRAMPIAAAALLLPAAIPPAGAATGERPAPHVAQFTPQGTVKDVRQVAARFSEPMVPLGDPRVATDIFEVQCPEAGAARWVDSRNWVYDFARDLPAGVRCTFRLRAGAAALAGTPLGGPREFTFSTGGPAIRSSIPPEGDEGIDEEQAFVLRLDAQPTEASVLEHVSFAVEGLAERVGARLLTGEAREAILKARFRRPPAGPLLVLQARQRFPSGSMVKLIWGQGVTSASGVPTEEDQTLPFKVREAFKAEFRCERENRYAACIPLTPMLLQFSAPVPWEQARHSALVGPEGRRWTAEAPEDEENVPAVHQVVFKSPFPEKATFRVEVPSGLTDDAGRPPVNAGAFPLTVRTEEFPPLAKFSARFGIVEWKADPVLPVTVRNLDAAPRPRRRGPAGGTGAGAPATAQAPTDRIVGKVLRIPPEKGGAIQAWLRKLAGAQRNTSVFASPEPGSTVRPFALPKPHGAKAFEVMGIPFKEPGLYILELESARLGASLLEGGGTMYVPTAALVTNLSVHFKWGRTNSLAWVTTLDEAKPVAAAEVAVRDCRGKAVWSGKTDAHGIARIGTLPAREALPRCGSYPQGSEDYPQLHALLDLHQGLLVTATMENDLSFVHSSWQQGIEPWRFRLPFEDFRGPTVAHTILDRPLFRAGDTVHMKHVLRRETLRRLALLPAGDRPRTVLIRHLGSDQKYEVPVTWDAAGISESAWTIPKEAKLGRYEIVFPAPGGAGRAGPARRRQSGPQQEWVSGAFRVEEFRVPLMRATIKPPSAALVAVSEFPLDLSVQYLAGGGAGKLPVKLRTQVQPKAVSGFEAFEGFAFGNGAVKEGIVRPGAGIVEDEGEGTEMEADEAAPPERPLPPRVQDLVLDAGGTARAAVTRLPRAATPLDVLAELEFRDPNGEVQTVSARVPLWPAKWLVGIRPDTWMATRDSLKARAAVADLSGKPVAGAPVRVDILQRKFYSHRKRLVGGFYAFEHVEETRRLGEFCRGTTDAKGLLSCEGRAPADGNLILQATAADDAGHATGVHQDVWVAGSEEMWFTVPDSDRIDLLPERPRYEPGETVRLQVRMPFRRATALVTVERDGVLDASVVTLLGREPVITFPAWKDYAPNVFVSVLAVRGRVGGVQPTAMVDLGKPAFKLGMAEIRVGWRDHELRVTVSPERATYRVRETARVRIAVRTAPGEAPPRGSEVAVAAVDEGLLELAPNGSWNILEAMMRRRGHGVETATAQMQVVGRRHFGLKALPQGGGGGRQPTRELFDTLLLWKGRVRLDRQGAASVDVPLNDSLTSFRIVAVATGGAGLFGTGAASIRSTQDLMILPGIAPLVREGDAFRSEVTLRNTTDRPMDLTLRGRVEGLPAPLTAQALRLLPGDAKTAGWDVTAPVGVSALRYEVEATEPGGTADRIRVTQQVVPAVPVRTYQATLFRWEGAVRQPVERPADATPGRGGVQVAFRPTLTEGLPSLREWMLRYPYTCLEQLTSRAVALRDEGMWRGIAATLPSYLDADGLLKYFPTMLEGSEVLTAYVLAVIHESGWTVPDDVRTKMEDGLLQFVEGKIARRSALPTADLSLRKLAAIEALARHGKAAPPLLGSITIEPNLWPTSAVLDWWGILRRVRGIPQQDARLAEAEQILRSRLNLQGTTMGFSTERSDHLWWLMVSPDTNAVRLILHLLDANEWRDDLPRLMRGALARQRRGAWDLTVTNAWGALAVEKFSQAFERVPVTGASAAALGGTQRRIDWGQAPKGGTLAFPWPSPGQDLTVDHAGTGNPWVTVRTDAAIPLQAPLSSGYKITKTLTPIEPQRPGGFRRGDLVRVSLTIEAQADMTWVVVNDPIPAGASHLGTGLARDSAIATQGERERGWAWPAYQERSFEAFRAYYAFVPKGTFTLEYTIRLNQGGRLHLPTTRVEALYAPEMFGELPNAPLEVQP